MTIASSFFRNFLSAAVRIAPAALIVGSFGAIQSAYAGTCGPAGSGGQTIYESSGFTSAGCLLPNAALTDKQWCAKQNLTIFLPVNSGTCLVCVESKYAPLVAKDILYQEANPAGYIFLPNSFAETALTLDQYPISYFDGVHTPFRCLKCTARPAGMTAWWTFDQWSGQPVIDAIHNMPDGVSTGTSIVTGQSGNAAYFNGAAHIDVPSTPNDSAHVDAGTDFSIDAWVKIDPGTDLSGARAIVDKRTRLNKFYLGTTGYSFFLYNGNVSLQLADGTTIANYFTPSLTVPADGHWHFVGVSVARTLLTPAQCAAMPNACPAIRFTLDNAVVQDPSTPLTSSVSNTSGLRIGMDNFNAAGFVGSIDEVEFFRRALAPNEFQAIYNAKCYGKCK